MAHAAGEVIVIKDVPAYVCEQCGEAYYTATTSRKIDGVMRDAQLEKIVYAPAPGRRGISEWIIFLKC